MGIAAMMGVADSSGVAQDIAVEPDVVLQPPSADPFADDDGVPPIVTPATVSRSRGLDWPLAPGTLDRLHGPILRRDLQILGAQSCASSNCHGGPRPGVSQPTARRGSEYQIWNENDPHAQSWRTICGDESVAIMNRLGIMQGDQIVDQAGFDNCLACHNTTKRFDEPRSLVDRREGVGCAGCHGPSGQWVGTHYQYHWSPASSAHEGFVDAGDLYVRARMCASCHVGDKDRDMNHDIIAAGHPTLRYELATFHAWQPKHWRDHEAGDKTFYEAQLWLAGQIAATDSSLSLLETRAGDSHSESEWPEFAAYNCASCHHNLGLDNDRDPLDPTRKATAMYSQWNDAGLRWLIDYRQQSGAATQEDHELVAALDHVEQLMETKPKPDAASVAMAAGHARRALTAWFDGAAGMHERTTFRSDRLAQVVASAAGKNRTFKTWESAVQFYLAAVAARESWPGGWNGPLKSVADQLRYGLRYPDMIEVSRYGQRGEGGPTASRNEAMRTGIELAGWLGPVVQDSTKADEELSADPAALQSEIEQLLKEIAERWKDSPRDAAPPKSAVDPPARNVTPPPGNETERQSIEDLRKSLEALQSGSGDTAIPGANN